MTYFPKVYKTCYMILRNHDLAEEVAQETFITAYEKIHTLQKPANFSSWVTSIAANKAITLYKRNKKVFPIDEAKILDHFEQENVGITDLADILITEELICEVKEAIDELKPEMKQLIILKYYLTMEDREIGEQLGKPVGTVKSSLYRAKRSLARTLSAKNINPNSLRKGCEEC